MTTDIAYTVSLKTYSDDTEVTLFVNGNTIPLQKNAQTPGTYSGMFKAGFFDSLMNAKLVNNYRLIDSTIMVFDSGVDTQGLNETYILDPDGNRVWENPKY